MDNSKINTCTCKDIFENMVSISNIAKGLYEDCLESKNNLLNKETNTLSETNTV